MYITLQDVKAHLYVDYTDEDEYLTHLISVAESSVANLINRPLSDVVVDGILPTPLKHAMLLLVGKYYAHREGEMGKGSMEVPFTLASLFMPYRLER